MKTQIGTIFILITVFILAACAPAQAPVSTETATPAILRAVGLEPPPLERLPPMIPMEQVLLLTPQTDQQLQAYNVEGEYAQLAFAQVSPELLDVQIGQILVAGPQDAAPSGYLRRVIGLDQVGDQLILQTEQAALVDVVQQGYLEVKRSFSTDDVQSFHGKPGMTLVRSAPPALKDKIIIRLDQVLFEDSPDQKITASGWIELEPQVVFDLTIKNFDIQQLTFQTIIAQTTHLEVDAKMTLAQAHETLYRQSLTLTPFVAYFPGTSFPVWITPVISFSIAFDGQLTAGIKTGLHQVGVYRTGVIYKDGNKQLSWHTEVSDPEPIYPAVYLFSKAKISAGPELTLKLYEVVGPYASMKSYVKLNIEPIDHSKPLLEALGGVEGEVGIKVEIFGGTLAQISYPIEIAEKTLYTMAHSSEEVAQPPPEEGLPLPPAPTNITTHPMDGMEMVLIPAGEFIMGAQVSADRVEDNPAHGVYLDEFWIDRTEVTNAQFARFVEATGYVTQAEQNGWSYYSSRAFPLFATGEGVDWQHPQGPETNLDGLWDHPVVHISLFDAQAYCQWAGRRLPTEAEWEKAARGTQGLRYPWGNDEPAGHLANLLDSGSANGFFSVDYADGYAYTAPVGSYPDGASPYGVLDMAGNVKEWIADQYDKEAYGKTSYRNPLYTGFSLFCVQRGGSWASDETGALTTSRSSSTAGASSSENGFRCAMSADG